MFLGYSLTQSAYLCLDPDTGRVYTSRIVQFDEAVYPFGAPMKNNVCMQPRASEATHSTSSAAVTEVHVVQPSSVPCSGPHPSASTSTSAPVVTPSPVSVPAPQPPPSDSAQVLPSLLSTTPSLNPTG